jgi:hypothetical protein
LGLGVHVRALQLGRPSLPNWRDAVTDLSHCQTLCVIIAQPRRP